LEDEQTKKLRFDEFFEGSGMSQEEIDLWHHKEFERLTGNQMHTSPPNAPKVPVSVPNVRRAKYG
jgi:hypothetical protein